MAQMFGRSPTKPAREEMKVEVREIYTEKRRHKLTKEELYGKIKQVQMEMVKPQGS